MLHKERDFISQDVDSLEQLKYKYAWPYCVNEANATKYL